VFKRSEKITVLICMLLSKLCTVVMDVNWNTGVRSTSPAVQCFLSVTRKTAVTDGIADLGTEP
jgi:hypothetical protein